MFENSDDVEKNCISKYEDCGRLLVRLLYQNMIRTWSGFGYDDCSTVMSSLKLGRMWAAQKYPAKRVLF